MLQPDLKAIKEFFYDILQKNIPAHAFSWQEKSMAAIENSENDKSLFTSFSMAPRFVGKEKLVLTNEDFDRANKIRNGFHFGNFSTDQAARLLLLLSAYKYDIENFVLKVEKILNAADIQEQIAIYSSLALLPHPEKFSGVAADGIRTNMTAAFDAIALENPFPSEQLSLNPWNQMVLKAIFTNRPLYKIYGFDTRRNAALANMLSDFAHERWAAGRSLSPEVWRSFSPFLDENYFKDIKKILSSENPLEVEAGCLVCSESTWQNAKEALQQFPQIKEQIDSGKISWHLLGLKLEALPK